MLYPRIPPTACSEENGATVDSRSRDARSTGAWNEERSLGHQNGLRKQAALMRGGCWGITGASGGRIERSTGNNGARRVDKRDTSPESKKAEESGRRGGTSSEGYVGRALPTQRTSKTQWRVIGKSQLFLRVSPTLYGVYDADRFPSHPWSWIEPRLCVKAKYKTLTL